VDCLERVRTHAGYDGFMISTARRRWSRELGTEASGIAFGPEGPVLVHGFDPPAGGKWLDDVIPGKLAALDRNSGELQWIAPCEIGYGRGFAAGFGALGQALVLGPSTHGHRMVRMSLENGELLECSDIAPFDESVVATDVCHCASAQRVFALDSRTLKETWEYAREGERYHGLVRSGNRVYVSVTQVSGGAGDADPQGVLILDASTGEYVGYLLRPCLSTIHGLCATGGLVIVFTEQIESVIGSDRMGEYALALGSHPGGGNRDTLSMLALREDGSSDGSPLWFRILETVPVGDIPEVSVSADNGKLYVVRGALLEALDALSGRPLGDWTVPGLDMKIGWTVVAGAGLLAEETRVSLFELPA